MARHRIYELLRILNRSFDGSPHSLLSNLATVTEEDWGVLLPGAQRSIREIVSHIGMFKYMYANHGFREASRTTGVPLPARQCNVWQRLNPRPRG